MRNGTRILITVKSETSPSAEETTWSLPGAFIGFFSWLLAVGIPFWVYGANTLFFLLYTWPFFLALMPVAMVTGIAVHSVMHRRIFYSSLFTLVTVALMFGVLFMWLMG